MTSCFQVHICLEGNRKWEVSFGLLNLASSSSEDEIVSFIVPVLTAGIWYIVLKCTL